MSYSSLSSRNRSQVVIDHDNVIYGKGVVDQELPKGKKVKPTSVSEGESRLGLFAGRLVKLSAAPLMPSQEQ
jgi:hypothetical protein